MFEKLIAFITSHPELISALASTVLPLLLARFSPKVAKILFEIIGSVFKIPLPSTISDKAWDGMRLSAQVESPLDTNIEALDKLMEAARIELRAGRMDNAAVFMTLIKDRITEVPAHATT